MDIKDFLSPENVMADVEASDKAELLQDLSRRAASAIGVDPDLSTRAILRREALGSTGIGEGVAIPHARVEGVKRAYGILARLRIPIDFEAIDDHPVDVVFLLLLPAASESEQLNALACMARKLRDKSSIQKVRAAADSAGLYREIIG